MTDRPWGEIDDTVRGEFKPKPYYNPATDTLTFIFEDEDYERERINNLLTVYRSLDPSHRIIGCHIKNLANRLLKDVEALGLERKTLTLTIVLSTMHAATGEAVSKTIVVPLSKYATNVRMAELVPN